MQVEIESARGNPRRLRHEPIVDALCEIRFSGSKDVGSLLPGLLLPKLKDGFGKFERLPQADLPAQIRDIDPNLQHVCLYRLVGAHGVIGIGDRVLQVAIANGQYPGWNAFRPIVATVWGAALETGLLGSIERVSVKYVNFFPSSEGSGLSDVTTTVVQIGSHRVKNESVQVRTELTNAGCINVVQIVSPASVTAPEGPKGSGVVIDIDTIRMVGGMSDPIKLMDELDAAHEEEKRVFFELLSAETLVGCEPEYE